MIRNRQKGILNSSMTRFRQWKSEIVLTLKFVIDEFSFALYPLPQGNENEGRILVEITGKYFIGEIFFVIYHSKNLRPHFPHSSISRIMFIPLCKNISCFFPPYESFQWSHKVCFKISIFIDEEHLLQNKHIHKYNFKILFLVHPRGFTEKGPDMSICQLRPLKSCLCYTWWWQLSHQFRWHFSSYSSESCAFTNVLLYLRFWNYKPGFLSYRR